MKKKAKTPVYAVVLGSGLFADGSPTPVTAIRAREAFALTQEVKLKKLIFSGYRAPDNTAAKDKSEAGAMAEIVKSEAKALGKEAALPPLCLEEISLDTLGNAIFTAEHFLAGEKPGKLIIVTSPFHMERAIYLFTQVLSPEWIVEGRPSVEWEKETRQPGAAAALERAREFFKELKQGDVKAASAKLRARKPYTK